jgi:hypothetical protein
MSDQTTAEIMADLRLHSNLHPIMLYAADRLAELTAAVADLAEFGLRIVSLERTPDIDRVIATTPDRVLRLIDQDMVEP